MPQAVTPLSRARDGVLAYIRCRLEVESKMERGMVQESCTNPVAQEQLGMKLLNMEEAFSWRLIFGGEYGIGRRKVLLSQVISVYFPVPLQLFLRLHTLLTPFLLDWTWATQRFLNIMRFSVACMETQGWGGTEEKAVIQPDKGLTSTTCNCSHTGSRAQCHKLLKGNEGQKNVLS